MAQVATILLSVGLLTTTASVSQMLRGSGMVFSACFAVWFLKRSLNRCAHLEISRNLQPPCRPRGSRVFYSARASPSELHVDQVHAAWWCFQSVCDSLCTSGNRLLQPAKDQ